jgi:acetyl-CoA carboxylase biotin carboxyl carrier protein
MAQTIRSPLPGTFYRRPNPTSDPYVSEGDDVKAGDVVGLVEIMKSFHEVHADADGRIARFLVENEDLVDADQDIIELEPA